MDNFLDQIFGTKPEVAPYTPTDLPTEQIDSILANIKAFPDITQLGNLYQDYMTSGFENAGIDINAILKGGSDLTQQLEATSKDFLEGNIPQDLQDKIFRNSAFQNLMSGTAGSPMGGANTARNLGLTTLDLVNQGANLAGAAGNAAQRWAGLASGLIMSPSGMLITPQQQAQMTMQNNLYRQATQQMQNNVNAAPNPIAKGLSDIVENLTAAYLGGKVGTIGAGNAPATQAATPTYLGGSGQSDVSNPGYYVPQSPGSSPVFNPGVESSGGYLPSPSGQYDFSAVAPYTGIPEFNTTTAGTGGVDWNSMYAYNSNFGGGF